MLRLFLLNFWTPSPATPNVQMNCAAVPKVTPRPSGVAIGVDRLYGHIIEYPKEIGV